MKLLLVITESIIIIRIGLVYEYLFSKVHENKRK